MVVSLITQTLWETEPAVAAVPAEEMKERGKIAETLLKSRRTFFRSRRSPLPTTGSKRKKDGGNFRMDLNFPKNRENEKRKFINSRSFQK